MFRVKRSKFFYLVWTFGIFLIVLTFFYFPKFQNSPHDVLVINDIRLSHEIQSRLSKFENELTANRQVLDDLRNKLEDFLEKNHHILGNSFKHNYLPKDLIHCADDFSKNKFNATIEAIFATIPFDNPNGGAWKQGWDIQVNQSRWNSQKKLKVFVVPHSHNDPGWLKTFDQYFNEQTRHILNNILKKLSENPNYTFIWAETSFFAAWWETVKSEDSREAMKTLLDNGQLEIVTGGWVMNDEANTHYSAMIGQMVDGHEFLKHTLNYTPRYGWAIDPFGLSPTMAFLLKKMGFKGMVIQRVHYSVKKYLAQNHLLEFYWKQFWEPTSDDKNILCHIEPFYSYDIPHTCGPDPKICCQFDFKRLLPSRVTCPWKVPPQKITEANIALRSAMLADQYQKKAMLFKTDSLLIPLGDDFRWDKLSEWENQLSNYQKIFDFINSNNEFNIEIKWGTLGDYFQSMKGQKFPTLSGDFFTYADRDDNYWSGFYTTRPFHKSMDRMLENYVRSAEIIFTLTCIVSYPEKAFIEKHFEALTFARLNLDIFQHHDGITGTSKNLVVQDYSLRLFNSILKCQEIITAMTKILLHIEEVDENGPLSMMEIIPNHNSLPLQDIVKFNSEAKSYIIAYNSLGMEREELLCLAIPANLTGWIIRNPNGKLVEDVQINRVWDQNVSRTDVVEACFMSHLKAVALSQYTIELGSYTESSYESSETTMYNFNDTQHLSNNIEIESDKIKLVFNLTEGTLRRVVLHSGDLFKSCDIRLDFMTYETRKGKKSEKSGAYLFLPESSEAKPLSYSRPMIRVTKGSIMTRVEVLIDNQLSLRHQIVIVKGQEYFDLENEFHMVKGSFDNKELLMRFTTCIQNERTFYTDLNGLQMVRRKYYDKLPLQGNVYPLPSLGYIEDDWTRFSVLSAQPLSATSPYNGILEVFLDRRLLQDDKRGVNQGIFDNRRTRERFRIFIERKPQESIKPTVQVQRNLIRFLNPVHLMQTFSSNNQELSMMPKELPCDVHLMNFRTSVTSGEFYLFLHRFATSCDALCNASSNSFKLLPHLSSVIIDSLSPSVSSMTLSLLEEIKNNMNLSSLEVLMDQVDFAVYALRLK